MSYKSLCDLRELCGEILLTFRWEANPQPIELEDTQVEDVKESKESSEKLVEKEKDFTNVEFEDLGEEGA